MKIAASDLLEVPRAAITGSGLRLNIDVGIQYLEAWLRGSGCVPIYGLMEDAATAEISQAQVWQWVRHQAKMSDGRTVSASLVKDIVTEELQKLRNVVGAAKFETGKYALAGNLFLELSTSSEFPEFLTLRAYDYLD